MWTDQHPNFVTIDLNAMYFHGRWEEINASDMPCRVFPRADDVQLIRVRVIDCISDRCHGLIPIQKLTCDWFIENNCENHGLRFSKMYDRLVRCDRDSLFDGSGNVPSS